MSLVGRLFSRHKPRWEEAWQTYDGSIDADPAVWLVDLGAVEAAPVADLPVRLDVTARYPADRHPGPGPARLDELTEAVRVAARALGGVLVGRVARAGHCRLTAHLPSKPAEPVVISWPGAADPGAELATVVEYDPHWAYVRDRLAPDERQGHVLTDLAVVDQLTAHGDVLVVPRPVEHVGYFSQPMSAESAAAELRTDGFGVTVERDDEGEYALTAARTDPVAPPHLHELTWAVRQVVERHGGSYDGWSCAVTGPAAT